jgi:hypothetical protein
MRRCPTCNRNYPDDTLAFCLEDGAPLLTVDAAPPARFDPADATLRLSSSDSSSQPTEVFDPRALEMTRRSQTPPTIPVQPSRITNAPQENAFPQPDYTPAPPASPPAQKSTSPMVVAGITAIAVLLLVLVGIGIALLVRDTGSEAEKKRGENSNAAANKKESSNSASPEVSRNDSTKANTNSDNRNTPAAQSAMSRAEAKVVNGTPVTESDLNPLSFDELRRLRNTVYARHGRTFNTPELQSYFESRPWYRASYDYSDADLTQTDRANINLIQSVENSR